MARLQRKITIQDGGTAKDVLVVQMPHSKAEAWILRAALALGASDVDVSQLAGGTDAARIAAGIKLLFGLPFDKVQPLLTELLECCSLVLPTGALASLDPANADAHIEDLANLMVLRVEALKVNTGFLQHASLAPLRAMAAKWTPTLPPTPTPT